MPFFQGGGGGGSVVNVPKPKPPPKAPPPALPPILAAKAPPASSYGQQVTAANYANTPHNFGPVSAPVIPTSGAPPTHTDITSSGLGYGSAQANAYKNSPAYRQTVAQVFQAQSTMQKASIIAGLTHSNAWNTPEFHAVRGVWDHLPTPEMSQIAHTIPHDIGKFITSGQQGVDLGSVLSSGLQTAGRVLSSFHVPGASGNEQQIAQRQESAALGGPPINPLGGVQKALEQVGHGLSPLIQAIPTRGPSGPGEQIAARQAGIAPGQVGKNLGKDIVNLPAEVGPSVAIPAGQALSGHPVQALKTLAQPYVQTFQHPVQSAAQHPLITTLLAMGPIHAGTRVLDQGARAVAGKPADLTPPSIHLTGNLTKEQPNLSKYPLIRAGQKAVMNTRYERKTPRGPVVPKSDVVQRRGIAHGVSQRVGMNERIRRVEIMNQERAHTKAVLAPRLQRAAQVAKTTLSYNPKPALIRGADVLAMINERIIRRPDTALQDLRSEIAKISATRNNLAGYPKALAEHDANVAALQAELGRWEKDKNLQQHLAPAFAAVEKHGAAYEPLELKAWGFNHFGHGVEPDMLERRALTPIVDRHMPGARFDTERNTMVVDRSIPGAEALRAKLSQRQDSIARLLRDVQTRTPDRQAEIAAAQRAYDEALRREQGANSASPAQHSYVPAAADINGKTWYHGTNAKDLTAKQLDSAGTNEANLFGQGVYLTDNPEIARSYGEVRSRRSGESTVYRSKVQIRNPLDMEARVHPQFAQALADRLRHLVGIGDHQAAAHLEQLAKKPGMTNAALYKEFKTAVSDFSHHEEIPRSELVEDFQILASDLRQRGFDALTHVGGTRAGKGKTLHQVVILLDPANTGGLRGVTHQVTEFGRFEPHGAAATQARIAAEAQLKRLQRSPGEAAAAQRALRDVQARLAKHKTVETRVLTTKEMRDFALHETGGKMPSYSSHQAPKGDSAFYVSGQRFPSQAIQRNTMFAFHHGLRDASHNALLQARVHLQGVVSAHQSMGRLLGLLTEKRGSVHSDEIARLQARVADLKANRPSGAAADRIGAHQDSAIQALEQHIADLQAADKSGYWGSFDEARRDAPAGYRPIFVGRIHGYGEHVTPNDAVHAATLEHEAQTHALDLNARLAKSTEQGNWAIIHNTAVHQLQKHENQISPNALMRGFRGATNLFRRNALGTSPKHIPGIVQENLIRDVASGVFLPLHIHTFRKVHGEAEKINPELAAQRKIEQTGGQVAGMTTSLATRQTAQHFAGTALEGPLTKWDAFVRAPGPRQLGSMWRAWTHFALDSTKHYLEESHQQAAVGKQLLNEFGHLMRLQGDAAKQAAIHGYLDEKSARRMRAGTERMFGSWTDKTPEAQTALMVSPFGLWWVNSVKWLARLPIDHPLGTSALSAAYLGTEKQRNQMGFDMFAPNHLPLYMQGGIPSGNTVIGNNYYSPWGVANDPLETMQSLILPTVQPLLQAFAGTSWLGREMTSPQNPRGGPTTPGTRARVAINSILGLFLPLYQKAQTIAQGGASSYDTSTLIPQMHATGALASGIQTKEPNGGFIKGLEKAVNPVRKYDLHKPASGGGSGLFGHGSSSGGSLFGSIPNHVLSAAIGVPPIASKGKLAAAVNNAGQNIATTAGAIGAQVANAPKIPQQSMPVPTTALRPATKPELAQLLHGQPVSFLTSAPAFATKKTGTGNVNPLGHPGWSVGRTDQGVDANAPTGTPIVAPNDSKLVGSQSNWYKGQPLFAYQFTAGPDKGKYWYAAEQVTPMPGTTFKRGQPVATYAASGTGIEIGWAADPQGTTLAVAQGNTGDASHGNAPAGLDFVSHFLKGGASPTTYGPAPGSQPSVPKGGQFIVNQLPKGSRQATVQRYAQMQQPTQAGASPTQQNHVSVIQGAPLSDSQKVFGAELAKKTGLDPGVIAAWIHSEQPPTGLAPNGAHNWLNIGATDSGFFGASNPAWQNPSTAADFTAQWLGGKSAPGFGVASSGIQGILRTAGQSPAAQIAALQGSGWAGSGYPALAQVYNSLAGAVRLGTANVTLPTSAPGGAATGSTAGSSSTGASQSAPAASTGNPTLDAMMQNLPSTAPADALLQQQADQQRMQILSSFLSGSKKSPWDIGPKSNAAGGGLNLAALGLLPNSTVANLPALPTTRKKAVR